MKILSTFLPFLFFTAVTLAQNTYYVSNSGNNTNTGSFENPWQTIQYAANNAIAGDLIFVRGGSYEEAVTISNSGDEISGYITFKNFENEIPILNGENLTVPASNNGLFLIEDKSFIILDGFELKNYKTSISDIVPSGIFITGVSTFIEIKNCKIHSIEHNLSSNSGADAHGIAVYGTSSTNSINNILIDNNEIYNLILGSSEALVLNGNVENFTVTNNEVHDVNNIAIDCIGFEGVSGSLTNDQARSGVISKNLIYNVSSYGNPAYGNEYSAGGIYIDGGKDIIVEQNIIHNADIGIELASEHKGKSTNNITVRNNLIYDNNVAGLAMGGYNLLRGSTENCKVLNNTFYNNDTQNDGNGELWLQYDVKNSEIKNNIFYCNAQGILISNPYTQNTDNVVDYNMYFSPTGENNSSWYWMDVGYYEFSTYKSSTGNDANGLFSNPNFINEINLDLNLSSSSPARDIGDNTVLAGSFDNNGNNRIQNSTIDIGCYEYYDGIQIRIKTFLQGSYNSDSHQMNNNIQPPLASPYSDDLSTVNTLPSDVVDWVLVQLRSSPTDNAVISKSLFLRNDGMIIDEEGNDILNFPVDAGNYYISIKHRNHLQILSSQTVN